MKPSATSSLAGGFKWVCLGVWAFSAGAGETPQEASGLPSVSDQELAKEKHNPFADQITVPIQLSSSLQVGPGNGTAGGLNLQPAIPISLGQDWLLITRPSLSLLATEQPNRKLGLGDLQVQNYFTPRSADKWIWGIGPVLQAPAATEDVLGAGKWCAGPAVGLVFMSGPWVNGILVNHIWSFAGDRERNAVSLSTLMAAGLNVIPPALCLLGIGVLFHGVWPRATSYAVYAVLTWSLLVEIVGGIGATSHWVLDTSIFHQMAAAPAVAADWATGGWMIAVGAACAVVGALAFRRRDLLGE